MFVEKDSSEALTKATDRCSIRVADQDKQWLKEMRSLYRSRPCVDGDDLLHFEVRISNSPK